MSTICQLTLYHGKYNTVKSLLGGHLWDREKVALKTGDLFKEIQII